MADITTAEKPIWKSKTVWFNILTMVLTIVAMINSDFLTGLGIPPESQVTALKIVGTVVAVINIVLRFISTGAVTLTKPTA